MSGEPQIEEARLETLTEQPKAEAPAVAEQMHHVELKRRAARGVLSSSASQVATLGLRMVSMVILARLLTPHDFGLVGMVTAVTGFMVRFKDAGLSDAAVQSANINQDQLSMLFWINVVVGSGLGLLCAFGAHFTAVFYKEPRLFWIMMAAGTSFVFTGLGTQHRAMLLRTMRIQALSLIDVLSLVASIVISIGMAAAGLGYWALVAATIILPATNALGVWMAAHWVPSRPKRHSGVRSLVVYGGTVTLNSVVVYLAYNVEKVLLGRFWGADALGIYGRAYTLVNLPTDSLHTTMGSVAFPALSRVQHDPERFRSYFLRMYGLFLAVSFPITVACALFAEDIVRVFLGAQWHEAAAPFRLLAPTILVFAIINPFGWQLFASGRVARSLKIALMIAPVTILAYVIGLKHGPNGVAIGFSIAMALLVVPVVLWSRRDTLITARDAFKTLAQPGGSIMVGTGAALLLMPWVSKVQWPLLRLTIESSILLGTYALVLLFAFGQKRVYVQLLRQTGLWPSWLPQAAATEN
jgi:PST family polysaccharide transporter